MENSLNVSIESIFPLATTSYWLAVYVKWALSSFPAFQTLSQDFRFGCMALPCEQMSPRSFFALCFVISYLIVRRGSGWGGCKCQLSVKILAISQLSVKFKAICQLAVNWL